MQLNPYNDLMNTKCLVCDQGIARTFRRWMLLAGFISISFLSACQAVLPIETVHPSATEPAASPTLTSTTNRIPSLTPTPSRTPTQPPSQSPTSSPTVTLTPSPTVTPTYTILRAKVLVRANCRYGPGWPYLYKYGLVVGSNFEVLGRTDAGTWLLVQGVGDHDNACWVKADLMDVKGDVMTVQPTYIPLPESPYYVPPTGVTASRDGDNVTVSWNAISFRAGDETASPPYLLEAWLCQDGQLIFTPVGTYETMVTVVDEAGCAEPSHGRVFGVEKHGYTNWVEVPWPEH